MTIPDRIQTSPYLTFIWPDRPLPIVYMSDTLGPSYPEMTDCGSAKFGVIGLDREIIWRPDIEALQLLEFSAREPVRSGDLIQRFGQPLVAELVGKGWLQGPADLCRDYFLRTGQIEITAHCNWGCKYCPVALDPKPRETMPISLFTEIIEKLSPYDTIKYVTFHFFNEPTLDKHFAERIKVLAKYGTKLSLASNASALTADKVDLLVATGVMHHLVINMPTVGEDEFAEMTGARTYAQSMRNLDYAIKAEAFPITLAVNGVKGKMEDRLQAVKDRYEPRGVEVITQLTCDRAGVLDGGEYEQDVYVADRLRGCSWPVNHAYFSVRGDMFICCNDYYQREIFGTIRGHTVHEVMTSEAAVRLRQRVFGVTETPSDFICRSCHDQLIDFVHRQFRPPATFPLLDISGRACQR